MDIFAMGKDNLKSIGLVTGGVATGAVLGAGAATIISSRKRRKKASRSVRKKTSRRRKQKRPYTARKRRDRSTRRIRYTKNNQPYIILASGKARFISKKSVRTSRKRKGGRY